MLEIKNWYDCSKCGKALDDGEFEKIAGKIVCFKCMVEELKNEIARLKKENKNLKSSSKKNLEKDNVKYPTTKDWFEDLCSWADENNILENILPRDKKELIKLKKLDLSNLHLKEITESIEGLEGLKELWFYNNNIEKLPESIGNLVNLERLNFSKNNISKIPESIGNLINLRELWFNNNNIEKLPESIGNLVNLEHLWFYKNRIKEFPDSIVKLKKLKWFRFYSNCDIRLTKSQEEWLYQIRKNFG